MATRKITITTPTHTHTNTHNPEQQQILRVEESDIGVVKVPKMSRFWQQIMRHAKKQ